VSVEYPELVRGDGTFCVHDTSPYGWLGTRPHL
jgi:hypothetical protein